MIEARGDFASSFLFLKRFLMGDIAHWKGIVMKENLSDFLKLAYEYGKVKELKEAFEEFPVEEEWHKGKVEEYKKKFISSLRK